MKVLSLKELCYLSLYDAPSISTERLCEDLREFLEICDTKGWCSFCCEFVGEKGLMNYLYHNNNCGYFVEYFHRFVKNPVRIHIEGRRCEHCAAAITPDSEEAYILPFVSLGLGSSHYEVIVCSRFCPGFSEEDDVPYLDYCEECEHLCFVPLEFFDACYDSLYKSQKSMFREWNQTFLNTLHAGNPKPYIPLCSDSCEIAFKGGVGIRWCIYCGKDMCTGFPYKTENYQRHLRVCLNKNRWRDPYKS